LGSFTAQESAATGRSIEFEEARVMDDHAFDAVAKRMGAGNRRVLLRGLVGLGGLALAGGLARSDVDAARRGFSGPGGSKQIDCPAYCDGEELLVIQQESNGICVGLFRFWCVSDQICLDGACRPRP
jgi:hypothetical protein